MTPPPQKKKKKKKKNLFNLQVTPKTYKKTLMTQKKDTFVFWETPQNILIRNFEPPKRLRLGARVRIQ